MCSMGKKVFEREELRNMGLTIRVWRVLLSMSSGPQIIAEITLRCKLLIIDFCVTVRIEMFRVVGW